MSGNQLQPQQQAVRCGLARFGMFVVSFVAAAAIATITGIVIVVAFLIIFADCTTSSC